MPMPFDPLAPGAVLPDAEQQCRQLAELIRPRLRPDTAIVGILSGGAWIAERLAELLGIADRGAINVSFYRDDFEKIGLHPNVQPTSLPFAVDDRTLLIVDDVLHTGRTTRAAINVLFDFGRPAQVELAVLAERPGRHLPFAPDYCAWRVHPADTTMLTLSRDDAGQLSWRLEAAEADHA